MVNWLFHALRVQRRRQAAHHRAAQRRAGECRGRKPRFEFLENRLLLTAIQWVGGATGLWDQKGNWSNDAVPTAADDVTVNTPATITIQSGDSESVGSLTTVSNSTLSITGGSLSVGRSGDPTLNSVLSGGLAMTGGSLAATGTSVTLQVNGATTVSAANLYAEAGANLSLPNLISYTANGTESALEATGTGSVLSLANLTSLADNSYSDTVEAASGGTINLPVLAGIAANFNLTAQGGGQISAPDLTTLASVDLTLSSATGLTTSQIASLTYCGINVSGASPSFAGVTDLDASSVTASGGATLSFPGVTSYTANGTESTLQATGTGSTLSLPNLTHLADNSYSDTIEAASGGTVNLPVLAGIAANFNLTAQGSGQISAPDLTTLASVNLTLSSATGLTTSQITSLTYCGINVSGGIPSFAGVTDLNASSVTASGGATLSFPGVTSYTANGTESTLEATGTGSTLTFANLTSLADDSYSDSIEAQSGGTVNLPVLAGIAANFYLAAQNGGQISAPDLTTLASVNLTLDSSTAMTTSQITSMTSCAINVGGGSPNFADVTDLDDSSATASGGATLSFPGVTSYTANGTESVLEATGTGSTLSLPNLTSLADDSYSDTIEAQSGGTVNLPVLAGIAANFNLTAQGSGQITAPDLTTLASVNLTLSSATGLTTSQITSLTYCGINVSGGKSQLCRRDGSQRLQRHRQRRGDALVPRRDQLHRQWHRKCTGGHRHRQHAEPSQPHRSGRRLVFRHDLGPERRDGQSTSPGWHRGELQPDKPKRRPDHRARLDRPGRRESHAQFVHGPDHRPDYLVDQLRDQCQRRQPQLCRRDGSQCLQRHRQRRGDAFVPRGDQLHRQWQRKYARGHRHRQHADLR